MDNLAYDYGLLTNLLITICMVFEHRDINLQYLYLDGLSIVCMDD